MHNFSSKVVHQLYITEISAHADAKIVSLNWQLPTITMVKLYHDLAYYWGTGLGKE
jgi:hypothetical protein